MMTPFSVMIQNRARKRSQSILARNVLKRLLAVTPPPTVDELRAQGRALLTPPPLRG